MKFPKVIASLEGLAYWLKKCGDQRSVRKVIRKNGRYSVRSLRIHLESGDRILLLNSSGKLSPVYKAKEIPNELEKE